MSVQSTWYSRQGDIRLVILDACNERDSISKMDPDNYETWNDDSKASHDSLRDLRQLMVANREIVMIDCFDERYPFTIDDGDGISYYESRFFPEDLGCDDGSTVVIFAFDREYLLQTMGEPAIPCHWIQMRLKDPDPPLPGIDEMDIESYPLEDLLLNVGPNFVKRERAIVSAVDFVQDVLNLNRAFPLGEMEFSMNQGLMGARDHVIPDIMGVRQPNDSSGEEAIALDHVLSEIVERGEGKPKTSAMRLRALMSYGKSFDEQAIEDVFFYLRGLHILMKLNR